METKVATALAHGSSKDATGAVVAQVKKQLAGAQPALVLAFASTKQPLAEVMPTLRSEFAGATLLGSETSGEFTEKGDAKGSLVLFAVAGDFRAFAGMGTELGAGCEAAVTHATADLPPTVDGYPHRTCILLLDALSGNAEETVLLTAGALGGDLRLAGGAAGDDLAMKATHIALGTKVAKDAVVVCTLFSKKPLGVGVCHGHKPLSPSLKVTKASGGTIHTIEGRPAWDVWVDSTRADAKQRGVDVDHLKPDEIGVHLLRYEAGLATGSEYKIRAPLAKNADGSIAFACGIPEGAVIRITESDPGRQITSAREAARRAKLQLGNVPLAGALVFDCVCRNLILGDRFKEAVAAMAHELGDVPLAGFETYGEIALDAGDLSGFHNTTSAVLAFPR